MTVDIKPDAKPDDQTNQSQPTQDLHDQRQEPHGHQPKAQDQRINDDRRNRKAVEDGQRLILGAS